MDELLLEELIRRYTTVFLCHPDTPYLHALARLELQLQRNELAVFLQPVVEPLADRVACHRGLREAVRQDFREESVWYLLEPRRRSRPRICTWSRTLGRFEGWCHRVLTRQACDVHNQLQTHAHSELLDTDSSPADEERVLRRAALRAVAEFFDRPFSPADLVVIGSWNIRYQLELTVISGLWVKFTPDERARICRAYEIAQAVTLPDPFPPLQIWAADSPEERIAVLEPVLGYNRTALLNRWKRNRDWLDSLESSRELRELLAEAGDAPEP